MSHHVLAATGLIANIVGALLLIKFPAKVHGYLPDGRSYGSFAGPPTPEGLRRYRLGVRGFYSAIGALVLGFLLQLIDLLHG